MRSAARDASRPAKVRGSIRSRTGRRLPRLRSEVDQAVLAPVYETIARVKAALDAGHRAARLLRRAVDGRDLHDRRARHARPGAGAAVRLSRSGGFRTADRCAGRSLGRLSGAAVRGRRRCRADVRYLGRRAAAGRVRSAGASSRRGGSSKACARRCRARKIIGFPRGAGTIARRLSAKPCRSNAVGARLDDRSGGRARPAFQQRVAGAGQSRSAGAARRRRGARSCRRRCPRGVRRPAASSSISATASCRRRRSRMSSRCSSGCGASWLLKTCLGHGSRRAAVGCAPHHEGCNMSTSS